MKQRRAKIIAWLLVFAMLYGSILPYSADMVSAKVKSSVSKGNLKKTDGLQKLSNPRIEKDESMQAGQRVTWDCVWFGSYPQAEVVPASEDYTALDKELLQEGDLIQDDELYQKLKSAAGWDKQGDVEIDNQKYRRIKEADGTYSDNSYQWENDVDYHYFQYQPIKWRALSVNGTQIFLVSDKILDEQYYHDVRQNEAEERDWDATWEDSTMRSWLNGYGASANQQKKDYGSNSFINIAFSSSARTAIRDTQVENKDNLSYGTKAGKDTVDKIFLLSESEVYIDNAKKYGFVSDGNVYDEARRAKSSVYAKALGAWSTDSAGYIGNGGWWLRSPGYSSPIVTIVNSDGWVNGYYCRLSGHSKGVRPALNLNLAVSSDSGTSKVWSYAGTVCSDGTMDEKKPPEKTEDSLSNPRIVLDSSMEAGQKVTWDCVWFGSYPQAEVVPDSKEYTALDKELLQEGDLVRDDELYQKLKSATGWDKQGDVELDGEKYRRIKKENVTDASNDSDFYQWENETDYHYFKYQPIKWRVLSINGSEAFLLADQALDDKQYHTVSESVTWEGSTIRSWLNGYGASANLQKKDYSSSNFINTAFSLSARTVIKNTKVENKDSLHSDAEGGEDTLDKVFLLSQSEVYTDNAKAYGFTPDYNVSDEARRAKSSVYAKALGTRSDDFDDYAENCHWWLRSPGYYSSDASYVYSFGVAYWFDYGVKNPNLGVRPALNLNLTVSSDSSASEVWSHAGTVCSDGTVNEKVLSDKALFSNPRIEEDSRMEAGQKVTWDCVWFGSYPQAEVVPSNEAYMALDKELIQEGDLIRDDELYQKLISAKGWDEQGDVEIDNQKYRRIKKADATYADDGNGHYQWKNETDYHYFKYQPIKWRVLSVNDTEIVLLADNVLDNKPYHLVEEDVTWEKSTMRSWLNGYSAFANKQNKEYSRSNFINIAFNVTMRKAINDTDVENQDNFYSNTEGGNDTVDKIFLLSETDLRKEKGYGFASDDGVDEAGQVKSSLYAKALGTWSDYDSDNDIGNCYWWLRSPGYRSNMAACVNQGGWEYWGNDRGVDDAIPGVRPALNLNFASLSDTEFSNLWSYAGTVCSDGTVNEVSFSGQPSDDDKQDKATGVNVAYRTQKEIRDYAKKSGVSLKDALAFTENPVTAVPYALGKLSDKTLQSAVTMLNQIRYVAGVPDSVELSDSYNKLAQAAALSNYVNNDLSHYPVQPAGMPDDMYALAKEGASSSNISWASWAGRSLNDAIVSGWMKDGSDGNIPMVGHRRWILNPSMGKTGFGAVSGQNGTYSAMYTFDKSNSGAQEYGVMWPAQNMPVEYFDKEYPWSVSMGYAVDEAKVQVTLTREKDGKKWNFSKASADGDFYVNNDGYGQKGCIIFRPDKGVDKYSAGEKFKVKITGLEQGDVSYTVDFFTLAEAEMPTSKPTVVPDDPYIPYKPVIIPSSSPAITPKPSVSPSALPTAEPSNEPSGKPSEEPVNTPLPTVMPEPGEEPFHTSEPDGMDTSKKLKKGSKVKDKKTKAMYQVTGVGSNKVVEYLKSTQKDSKNVAIPTTVKLQGNCFKVTSVGKNAFRNNKKLKNVSMGKNVKKIGNGAFSGCKKLKNIVIGKDVTAIGANAFKGCSDLTMVTIPSKVKKIGAKAFYQCKNLRYIMVKTKKLTPDNVGKDAFSGGYRSPRIKTDKNIWRKYSRIFLKNGISKKALFIINPVKLVI